MKIYIIDWRKVTDSSHKVPITELSYKDHNI